MKFSCLDTTINLQTWVILLEFLGMGSKVQSNSQQTGCRDEDECADTESSHLSVTGSSCLLFGKGMRILSFNPISAFLLNDFVLIVGVFYH